jgi:CheY-like chemotaxis protein
MNGRKTSPFVDQAEARRPSLRNPSPVRGQLELGGAYSPWAEPLRASLGQGRGLHSRLTCKKLNPSTEHQRAGYTMDAMNVVRLIPGTRLGLSMQSAHRRGGHSSSAGEPAVRLVAATDALVSPCDNPGIERGQELVRLMVVDDSDAFRQAAQWVIESVSGLELVAEACSGHEALTRLPQSSPDIVLMDIRMPGLDGIETTRLIIKRWPNARVVLMTAGDIPSTAHTCGAAGVMQKHTLHTTSAAEWRELAGY